MSTPLDPETIAKILQEEASQPTRTRGPKVDPTADRSVNGWFRLQHHLCTPDCPHRVDPNNPTAEIGLNEEVIKLGAACWNPDCMDHVRDKEKDRGTNIVYPVKGQNICRYCYLGGYLV